MLLQKAILAALISFPVHSTDANDPDRASRLETKSVAYADVAQHATCAGPWNVPECKPIYGSVTELAAAIVVQDYSESTLRKDVQEGNCKPGECDSYKSRGVWFYKALGSFQIHRNSMPLDVWQHMAGLEFENVQAGAWYFATHFAGGVGRCHALEGGFAVMSGSHACTSPRAEARAKRTRALKIRIEQLMREQ